MKPNRLLRAAAAVLLLVVVHAAWATMPQKAAIIVYPQSKLATQYARIAQARLEQVLSDNGVTILDQKKAAELKKGWKKLEDPGALITAEEFVKNAGKYDIDGVYRVYLDASFANGVAGIYTATALADIRFVGEDAKISASAPSPMGSKGMPPSDGLTDSAAISNAIQRAVDLSIQQLGVKVIDFTNPRLFRIKLQPADGTTGIVLVQLPPRLDSSDPAVKLADLTNGEWSSEEVTCGRKSPDGGMALVGGYIRTFPERQYFSRLHVVDITAGKQVMKIDTTTFGADARGGNKLLDCLFVGNWRYIAALTGSKLFLWDTERGVEMNSVVLDPGLNNAELEYGNVGKDGYLTIMTDGRVYHTYEIVLE